MNPDGSANPILTTLYAAPMQPESWNVFLEQLSTLTGVTKAALIAHHVAGKDHRMLATLGDSVRDKESVQLYENCYCQFDEWTLRFPRRMAGKVIQGEEFWPEDSLLKSTFYNEFLKSVDICEMACVAIAGAPGVFEALSIYRGPGEDKFGQEQFAILQMLVPHLQSALATRRRLLALESRVADLENALDQLKTALVLVDAKGKPVLVNRAARQICDLRDGLSLNTSGLAARNSTETAKLRRIIAMAIAATTGNGLIHGGALQISRAGKRPLQVLAAPFLLQKVAVPGRAAAVVFISDPEQTPTVPSEVLRLLFGLTPAEARLAIALLEGKSLSEAAELNHVSRETVRTQIRNVFHETGTRRQSELIRLLSSLPG